MYRAFFPSFHFGIGTDTLGLFFGRIGFLGFLFVAHSIPPQRTLCARASSDLRTIATTAIQAFQPNSLTSCDPLLHTLTPIYSALPSVLCGGFQNLSLLADLPPLFPLHLPLLLLLVFHLCMFLFLLLCMFLYLVLYLGIVRCRLMSFDTIRWYLCPLSHTTHQNPSVLWHPFLLCCNKRTRCFLSLFFGNSFRLHSALAE